MTKTREFRATSRRALYRVLYPVFERPTLEVGRSLYDVIDCSERGLRFEAKDRRVPATGTVITGTLMLRRGHSIEVTGEVIRIRGSTVALSLEPPGITFGDILAEQRYLRARGYTLRD